MLNPKPMLKRQGFRILTIGIHQVNKRLSNEQKKQIVKTAIKTVLSGGFDTHRGNFKLREKVSLKDYDSTEYGADEFTKGGDAVTYFKSAILYIPDLIDIIIPEFDETKITEPEAIFFYHLVQAILRGLEYGTIDSNEFMSKHLPDRVVNPEHIIRAIDKIGKALTIIINADSFYLDLFMNALLTVWQTLLTWSENYDPQFMKDYGHTWFEHLKFDRAEYNCKVLEKLYELEHGEKIKVINNDGKYTIIRQEVKAI